MKNKMIFKVVFSSYMVALAVVFDLVMKAIPILKMPTGGSVTISLLPLALASVVCGLWYGVAAAVVYGVINCFVLDGYGFNLVSFILDYCRFHHLHVREKALDAGACGAYLPSAPPYTPPAHTSHRPAAGPDSRAPCAD